MAALGTAAPDGLLHSAHDLGDAMLLGLGLVGAFAETLGVQVRQLGPGSGEPAEVVLPDPGAQVEGDRCDRDRTCLEASLGHGSQLVVGVGQPGKDRGDQHAAAHTGLVEPPHRFQALVAEVAPRARPAATPRGRVSRSRGPA